MNRDTWTAADWRAFRQSLGAEPDEGDEEEGDDTDLAPVTIETGGEGG